MPTSKAPPSPNYDPNVVFAFAQEFAKNMQATTATIKELLGELKDHSVAMAQLKEQFSAMKENVAALNQVIREEGREGSVVTRVALLRSEVDAIKRWKEEQVKAKENEEKEEHKGKYALWIAVVTGGLAILSQIIQWLLGAAGVSIGGPHH